MKTGVIIGLGVAAVGLILLLTGQKVAGVKLKAGWNEYRYTGPARRAGDLFASIDPYLIMAWYRWEATNEWVVVSGDFWVQPNYYLGLNVSEDCTWTF